MSFLQNGDNDSEDGSSAFRGGSSTLTASRIQPLAFSPQSFGGLTNGQSDLSGGSSNTSRKGFFPYSGKSELQSPFGGSNKLGLNQNVELFSGYELEVVSESKSEKEELPSQDKIVVADSYLKISPYYSHVSKLEMSELFSKMMKWAQSEADGVKEVRRADDDSWSMSVCLDSNYDNTIVLINLFSSPEEKRELFKSVIEAKRIDGEGFGFDDFFLMFEEFLENSNLAEKPLDGNSTKQGEMAFSVRQTAFPMFDMDSGSGSGSDAFVIDDEEEEQSDIFFDLNPSDEIEEFSFE